MSSKQFICIKKIFPYDADMMSWIKNLIDRFTHTTMRVSILSLFLSLTLIAFGSTLAFLYYKNYQLTSRSSEKAIDAASKVLVAEVSDLLMETQKIVEISANLVPTLSDISPENDWLRSYMWQIIRFHQNMPYLFVGAENGNYLEVGNLTVSVQGHYLTDKTKPLPEGVVYEWQFFKRTENGLQAVTYYFDKNFRQLAEENVSSFDYDPRTRPWYVGAAKANQLYWSDVYTFFDTGDPGISAAAPIRDASGKLIGVFGADLSFEFLSRFLSAETIGKSGKAFILDAKTGKILIPEEDMRNSSIITEKIVEEAYRASLHSKQKNFSFEKDGTRYLAHIELFPSGTSADWLIAIVVPFDDFFADLQRAQMGALLIVLLICGLSSLAIVYFSKTLSIPIIALAQEIDKVKHLSLDSEKRVRSNIKEISLMESSIYSMKLALRSFVRYVPKAIVEQLLIQNKEIALGGEKKEVTVMFSDITDFTSITEDLPVEEITPLLEEYFDTLSKIILQNQGTIDKYIGDGVMAFWGAPKEIPDHAAICAEAVLLCNAFINDLNERHAKEGKPVFHTRFGIHTGTAIVGNVGTTERMNYTLMGDTVNSASRLQGVNKIYRTNIIISEESKQHLGPEFLTRPLDIVEVKGKKNKITIYELIGKTGSKPEIAPTEAKIALANQFSEAYKAFHANDLGRAKSLFEAIQKQFPEDPPTLLYLERLNASGPGAV